MRTDQIRRRRAATFDQLVYPTALRLRAADDESAAAAPRHLQGRAVPYNEPTNLGWFLESIAPGAFRKSIRESAISLPLLLWHDRQTWPIGVVDKWTEAAGGLDGDWLLDTSAEAERAADLADRGMLAGLSIGFQSLRETLMPDSTEDMPHYRVDEGRLIEVSLVAAPAYQSAVVTSVRSAAGSRRVASSGRPTPLVSDTPTRVDAPNLAKVQAWRASLPAST